jgi:potassium channel subfamily K, other eukaryote
VHPLSKLYICYYVCMAVILISTALAFFVSALIEKQEEFVMTAIVGPQDGNDHQSGASHPPRSSASILSFLPDWLADYDQVFSTLAFLIVVLAVGVWVFWHFEQMTLVNALYVTMVSATTVGFGDMGPTRAVTKVIMIGWLLISTATLGKLVGDQSEAFSRAKQRDATRRLLNARMDRGALRKMDRDSDGKVNSGEFLASCLVELGKVSQADIDEILNRFKQIDRDNSGSISGTEV